MDGKRSLIHIETSADCEIAGRHICSINKNEKKVAGLIMIAPELLDLAWELKAVLNPVHPLHKKAVELINKMNAI